MSRANGPVREAGAAEDVDLGGRVGRQRHRPVLAGEVELEARIDVVAGLRIGGDGGTAVGLRDAAEIVVRHQRAAERPIPRADDRDRHRARLDRHIGGNRSAAAHRCRSDDRHHEFFHRLTPFPKFSRPIGAATPVRREARKSPDFAPGRLCRKVNNRMGITGKAKPVASAAFLGVFGLSAIGKNPSVANPAQNSPVRASGCLAAGGRTAAPAGGYPQAERISDAERFCPAIDSAAAPS